MLLLLGLLAGCGENRTFPGPTPYAPGEEPRFTCVPNLDGVLEAGEVPVLIGGEVAYLVNPEGVSRRVDLDGVVDASGQRVWDLGADFADDRVVGVGPMALTDQWFADDFPGGDYVAPVDLEGTVLGVYHLDERGLWLHGVASAEPDPPAGRTLLPYDAPVPLYRFPLTQGDRYTVVGEVSVGTALGLAYRGTDTYEVDVLGAGRLDLPDWSFGQAWRVDTQVTVEAAAGATASRRLKSWLFECFGEVARAQGAPGTTAPFTEAAELRRITPRGLP